MQGIKACRSFTHVMEDTREGEGKSLSQLMTFFSPFSAPAEFFFALLFSNLFIFALSFPPRVPCVHVDASPCRFCSAPLIACPSLPLLRLVAVLVCVFDSPSDSSARLSPPFPLVSFSRYSFPHSCWHERTFVQDNIPYFILWTRVRNGWILLFFLFLSSSVPDWTLV